MWVANSSLLTSSKKKTQQSNGVSMHSNKDNDEIISHLAIGVGPSNLSLGALSVDKKDINLHFVERKKQFDWYEGVLLPSSKMQSSFIRDLVTPVEPTNALSFLSYLHDKKRLHQFLAAGFAEVPRFEFNDYYKWAASKIPNISFNECVNEVHYDNGFFRVHTGKRIIKAENLVLGLGNTPHYPNHCFPYVGDNVFHGMSYCNKDKAQFKGKKVAIVGGGQTGAEVFLDIFNDADNAPSELTWISRRPSFNPMEQSPFLSEVFTPEFSEYYFLQEDTAKRELLGQQKLASDGVSPSTLSNLYQCLYTARYYGNSVIKTNLLVNTEVDALTEFGESYKVKAVNKATQKSSEFDADILIYCTGLEFILPNFLYPIEDMLCKNECGLETKDDFSVKFKEDIKNKIYVQNGSTLSWGVSDRNLVLGAWRSAKIINSMLGADIYDLDFGDTFINWAG